MFIVLLSSIGKLTMILQEEKDNLNDRSFAFHYRYPFFSQGFLVFFPALSFSLHRFGALNRGNRKEERKRLCCRNIRKRRQKRPTMHVCVARNARIFFLWLSSSCCRGTAGKERKKKKAAMVVRSKHSAQLLGSTWNDSRFFFSFWIRSILWLFFFF